MTEVIVGGRPPRVLICDSNREMAGKLQRELVKNSLIDQAAMEHSIRDARAAVDSGALDIIFLGLLSFSLDEASDFLFAVRRERPEIVFSLYVDPVAYEQVAASFEGELTRLSH